MKRMSKRMSPAFFFCVVLFALAVIPSRVTANHAWGPPYHWARTANPFAVALGDNLSSGWDPYLSTTSSDWSQSTVLDAQIVSGGTTSRRCRATNGRVEVCNEKYGNNGWLGVAQIWISGTHITQGTVKVNDTYFNKSAYNTPAWRNLVMCQEVGHTVGLDHQDEDFGNTPLGTCMDYSANPEPNQHPNQHDYDMLEEIYAHLDTTTTIGQMPKGAANADLHSQAEWGKEVKNNGRAALYIRDFGGGNKVFTHVFWAQE